MAVIFDGYRQYGGLELSSGCLGNRGFRYESVVGGLEEVEDSRRSCLDEEATGRGVFVQDLQHEDCTSNCNLFETEH